MCCPDDRGINSKTTVDLQCFQYKDTRTMKCYIIYKKIVCNRNCQSFVLYIASSFRAVPQKKHKTEIM